MNEKYIAIGYVCFGIFTFILGVIGAKMEIDTPTLGEHVFSLCLSAMAIFMGVCFFIGGLVSFWSDDVK